MNFWITFAFLFCGVTLGFSEGIKVLDGNDPGSCDQSNHADEVLVKDRQNKEKILICTEDNGVYQWRTVDGLLPPGEYFNPSYDCSDIMDKDVAAKDGFYWIQFNGSVPKKVWCDMTTDGGGFMLIGRKNNSVTWTVPSNDNPVDPFGVPHWSSALGDAPILDFRVQMATSDNFKETKAHWSFRLRSVRPLKNLMIMNQGGCGPTSPGIGDIAFVKDLRTENIVTTNFRCSKFGGYHHPLTSFGWSMMNSCLRKPCQFGFAFHHKYRIQTDYSGAFSYSATGNASGIVHDSTAFIGCDKGTCCGCYGPLGGAGDYCGNDCIAKPGGTVKTKVLTWFWVRSTLPKRVWKKCMEYKVTANNGDVVWYKLKDGSGIPVEGRCVKNEALMNDGIVVVPDSAIAKKVPSVPGLLQYRKDNKKLYVRANETWNVVAQEKKVLEKTSGMVEPRLNRFEKKLENQNQKVMKMLSTDFSRLETQLGNVNRTLGDVINVLLEDSSSIILFGKPKFHQQIKKWLPGQTAWHLCYRASRDGWQASDFHSRCDSKGATVTIIRVGKYIFGGYTDVSWDGSSRYQSSTNSFIFSLRNKDNLLPFKAPVYRYSQYAIYCSSSYGPTFGGGHDIHIRDNAHSNTGSYTNFGYTYRPPSGYSYGSSNTQALLAGSYSSFYVSQIEVFYLR